MLCSSVILHLRVPSRRLDGSPKSAALADSPGDALSLLKGFLMFPGQVTCLQLMMT